MKGRPSVSLWWSRNRWQNACLTVNPIRLSVCLQNSLCPTLCLTFKAKKGVSVLTTTNSTKYGCRCWLLKLRSFRSISSGVSELLLCYQPISIARDMKTLSWPLLQRVLSESSSRSHDVDFFHNVVNISMILVFLLKMSTHVLSLCSPSPRYIESTKTNTADETKSRETHLIQSQISWRYSLELSLRNGFPF